MPRKKSLFEATTARNNRRRGRQRQLTGERALTDTERIVKRQMFCFLKAQDFTYSYIGAKLGLTQDVLKKWAQEDVIRAEIAVICEDFVAGAISYARSYAIEMLEMLSEIARTTDDDATAIKAITEFLDRIGLAKVNKSESVSAQTIREQREVDLVDKSGLLEALSENAPPEVLQQVASQLDNVFSVVAEHTGKNVTHSDG